jgi:hypothetical protein
MKHRNINKPILQKPFISASCPLDKIFLISRRRNNSVVLEHAIGDPRIRLKCVSRVILCKELD